MKCLSFEKIFFLFAIALAKEGIGKPLSCDIPAPVAVLINAETGRILFEKNGDRICHPSSTTKLATCLYVLHRKGADSGMEGKITASREAVGTVSVPVRRQGGNHPSYRLERGGTHMGIIPGEELDWRTLITGMMVVSANDAANVLAEATSGSVPRFMEELNAFLRSIGCENTYFTNPHGLPDPQHVTTAKDFAKMARKACGYSIFKEIVGLSVWERPKTNKQPSCLLAQTNQLLRKGKYYYPYATGIKTGYTCEGGHNLIASAKKGDRDLIAVILHCDENFKRYRSAIQLFEAAFAEVKQTRTLLSAEHEVFSLPIEGAKNPLRATLESDVTVTFYPSEEQEYYSDIRWDFPDLPIKKGASVGTVSVFDMDGNPEVTKKLLAIKDVEPSFRYLFRKTMAAAIESIRTKKHPLGYCFAAVLFMTGIGLLERKRLKSLRDRFF